MSAAPATTVRELTPHGRGGVSVLAVEGPDALARVAALVGSGPALRPGRVVLVRLAEPGAEGATDPGGERVELLDEALVWAESDARCELHLHGSPPLVRRVRALLAPEGAGEEPGPRSIEDEARALLADAPGEAAARTLLDQAEGALRRALEELLGSEDPSRAARALLAGAAAAEALLRPPRVLLVGPTNAGKSTLFNALVGHERALVHEEEGTTRDAVRERTELGGWVLELVDTAGERALAAGDPRGEVEGLGQALARRLAGGASALVRVVPAARLLAADGEPVAPDPGGPGGPGGPPSLTLASRADEVPAAALARLPAGVAASVSGLRAPAEARRLLAELLPPVLGLPARAWLPGRAVPFTAEQVALLRAAVRGGPPRPGEAALAGLERLLARGGP